MDIKKEKLEDFKTAISSTVRSISNSKKIDITFGNQPSKSAKNTINLPELTHESNKLNFEEIRAIADSTIFQKKLGVKKLEQLISKV